jgi:hypothetical protein
MTIQIRLMQEADAPKVVELYRAVYGEAYPVQSVYDPSAIIASQQAGDFYRVLAVRDDKVIGQTAVYRSGPPNPNLYEEGQGIVLAECRNQGILEQVMRYAHDTVYPENGLTQLWGEAVCNHVFMQKAGVKLNYVYTGIEIDLMPAAAYEKEKSSAARVSSLVGFKVADAAAQQIHLPAVYSKTIPWLYQPMGLQRQFITGNAALPHDKSTQATDRIYTTAGVARFTFMTLGQDFEATMQSKEKTAADQKCTVLQAYLNLTDPAAGAALEILRAHRYFLGGILPCWYGKDGILMQKILHAPNIEGIQTYGERGKQILDMVLEDRLAVNPVHN